MVRQVTDRLCSVGKAELTIAGPVILAAALGHVLRNRPCSVLVFHRQERWWWNKSRITLAACSPATAGPPPWVATDERPRSGGGSPAACVRRVVAQCGPDGFIPDGWKGAVAAELPLNLTPRDVPTCLVSVAARVPTGEHVFLGLNVPGPLAFALGGALAMRRRVTFCHFWRERSEYEPFFANFEPPWVG